MQLLPLVGLTAVKLPTLDEPSVSAPVLLNRPATGANPLWPVSLMRTVVDELTVKVCTTSALVELLAPPPTQEPLPLLKLPRVTPPLLRPTVEPLINTSLPSMRSTGVGVVPVSWCASPAADGVAISRS